MSKSLLFCGGVGNNQFTHFTEYLAALRTYFKTPLDGERALYKVRTLKMTGE
jgi:hypothetical protein